MPVVWNDSYRVNHVDLDEQHKQLFVLANDLLLSGNKTEEIANVTKLYDYCVFHFDFEERLIKIVKYPDHLNHKEQHKKLLKRLAVIVQRIKDDLFWVGQLEQEIIRWLMIHISIEDVKLVACIKKHG